MRPRGIPDHVVPADDPITFVISERQGDVHVFVSATFNIDFVRLIANNLSRRVQQPVKVFYDEYREKYRLCPIAPGAVVDTATYGIFCFACDLTPILNPQPVPTPPAGESGPVTAEHIPRPKNQWILYRQAKSQEVMDANPGITAAEISTMVAKMWRVEPLEVKNHWQAMAAEEDRRHKEMYPDYKYTAKRSTKKNKPLEEGSGAGNDDDEE